MRYVQLLQEPVQYINQGTRRYHFTQILLRFTHSVWWSNCYAWVRMFLENNMCNFSRQVRLYSCL